MDVYVAQLPTVILIEGYSYRVESHNRLYSNRRVFKTDIMVNICTIKEEI